MMYMLFYQCGAYVLKIPLILIIFGHEELSMTCNMVFSCFPILIHKHGK